MAKPVTRKDIDAVIEAVAQFVSPLLTRLDELEQRKVLHYAGVWRKDRTYDAGAVVTSGGSAWHANAKSQGVRPGDGRLWQLMVKHGKDAVK